MNIHRYYEPVDNMGFLHDINYIIEEVNKVLVIGMQTHIVSDGMVGERVISHADPLNEVTMAASYSILLKDNVMDADANYLLNTNT